MNASDIVETTLGTTLSAEQARLINGFLVLATLGYAEHHDPIVQLGTLAKDRVITKVRNLAMQGLKAPAIAIQLNTSQTTIYRVARENEITLNTTRTRVTPQIVAEAIDMLEDGDGVSVIGVAVEMDISPASLIRVINGDHSTMTANQKMRVANLKNLNYNLI